MGTSSRCLHRTTTHWQQQHQQQQHPYPLDVNSPNMAQSGVSVTPECIQAFNDLKLGKSTKWIIYKISDDWKEIQVEETSTDPDYSKFREKLLNAKSTDLEGNEGKRSKITFISWVPDDAPQYPRMMYSSSKDALKRALNGLASDIQANDPDDIEHESIVSRVSKGR